MTSKEFLISKGLMNTFGSLTLRENSDYDAEVLCDAIDQFKAAAIREAFGVFRETYLTHGMKYIDSSDINQFLTEYNQKQ